MLRERLPRSYLGGLDMSGDRPGKPRREIHRWLAILHNMEALRDTGFRRCQSLYREADGELH